VAGVSCNELVPEGNSLMRRSGKIVGTFENPLSGDQCGRGSRIKRYHLK